MPCQYPPRTEKQHGAHRDQRPSHDSSWSTAAARKSSISCEAALTPLLSARHQLAQAQVPTPPPATAAATRATLLHGGTGQSNGAGATSVFLPATLPQRGRARDQHVPQLDVPLPRCSAGCPPRNQLAQRGSPPAHRGQRPLRHSSRSATPRGITGCPPPCHLVFHHLADFLAEASGKLHEAFGARAPHPALHAAPSLAQDAAQLAARGALPPISNSS